MIRDIWRRKAYQSLNKYLALQSHRERGVPSGGHRENLGVVQPVEDRGAQFRPKLLEDALRKARDDAGDRSEECSTNLK